MRKWISDLLRVPSDVISGVPRIEMIGSHQVQVENFLQIDKFTNKEIRLQIQEGSLSILGDNLMIKRIYPSFILVEGDIHEVKHLD